MGSDRDAYIRKYADNKYLVFNRRILKQAEENKFEILDRVRAMDLVNSLPLAWVLVSKKRV